jgi:hypothetical protein
VASVVDRYTDEKDSVEDETERDWIDDDLEMDKVQGMYRSWTCLAMDMHRIMS